MAKKNKIKNNIFANKYDIKSSKITKKFNYGKQKVAYENHKPIFFFEDFIKESRFYTLEHSNADKNSLFNFLNSVKDISSISWGEIKRTPQFHAHGIDDEVANIPELNSFDDNIPFFQFKLPNHDKGRFIGYFDEKAIFHIVLYDRNHNLYKR